MKKLILKTLYFLLLGLLFSIIFVHLPLQNLEVVAKTQQKAEVNFFYSPTCPYCAQEKIFLEELEKKYPEVKIKKFELSGGNIELLKEFYQNYEVPQKLWGSVPITFIDDQYFLGFNEEVGKEIEDGIVGLIQKIPKEFNQQKAPPRDATAISLEEKIFLPILGKIDPTKYSLPVLTIILGVIDGFNVCSLGALALILALVLALRSRSRVVIFGGPFILITAIVYGILIIFWYQLFNLLGPFLRKMEILTGILAIGGGIYFLRQFLKFRKYGSQCRMKGGKIISKFSSKVQESFKNSKSLFAVLGSILLFAIIITVVEFPCSAAVPLVFAGILASLKLPILYYLLYIALFLLFYMLDEIIVFLIAVFTMKLWLTSSKLVIWFALAGAVILFLLGIYYLV
ncbi:MAG: hypothetical protein AB1465_04545 [Patescibacteria group bacterium]